MGHATKATAGAGAGAAAAAATEVATTSRMSTRRKAREQLQNHARNAKKRRVLATDKYIVYEAFAADAPREAIGRFIAGMKVEAVDTTKAWYRAEVLNVDHKKQEVLVHFVGYDHRFNQIMPFDSPLLRPAGRLESLARTLRSLDRSRSKARSPARRREPSPPWRLPGMDVEPDSRRVRRTVQKYTVGPEPPKANRDSAVKIAKVATAGGDVGRGTGISTSPPTAALVTHKKKAVPRAGVAAAAPHKAGGGATTKRRGKPGGANPKAIQKGAAKGTAKTTAKAKAAVRTKGGGGKSSSSQPSSRLASPTRRASSQGTLPPTPKRQAVKGGVRGAALTTATVARSRQQKRRPSPLAVHPLTAPTDGKPIKLRISKSPQTPSSTTVSVDGGGGGAASSSVSRTPSTASVRDDFVMFDFPFSPKFEPMEVREIITPGCRSVSGASTATHTREGSPDDAAATADVSQRSGVSPAAAAAAATNMGEQLVRAVGAAAETPDGDEDTSDEAFARRHNPRETEERQRIAPFERQPGANGGTPTSPYAKVAPPQRHSANSSPLRWSGVAPFAPRGFVGAPLPDLPSPLPDLEFMELPPLPIEVADATPPPGSVSEPAEMEQC